MRKLVIPTAAVLLSLALVPRQLPRPRAQTVSLENFSGDAGDRLLEPEQEIQSALPVVLSHLGDPSVRVHRCARLMRPARRRPARNRGATLSRPCGFG